MSIGITLSDRLLQALCQSVVASALVFAAVCWGGGIKAGKASSVVRLGLNNLE